jgi:hypothetical protein
LRDHCPMTPLWATIVIAVSSTLLGGLLGTLATIRHERGAEFRTRMLAAADDFLQAAGECTRLLGDVDRALKAEPRDDVELDRLFEQLREATRDLLIVTLPRIQLLFGVESLAWEKAATAHSALGELTFWLRAKRSPTSNPTEFAIRRAAEPWANAVGGFGKAARADVRRGVFRATVARAVRSWRKVGDPEQSPS